MTDVRQLHRKWSKGAAYRKAHAALQDEFDLASQLIAARTRAGMSQADVARTKPAALKMPALRPRSL